MLYEKSTNRSLHVLDNETNMEFLGSIRKAADEYWRFHPTDRAFTVREMKEIMQKISDMNRAG